MNTTSKNRRISWKAGLPRADFLTARQRLPESSQGNP